MKTVTTSQWVTERFLGAGAHLRSVLIELEEAIEYWHYRESGVEWEVVCDRAVDVEGLSRQVERAARELRGAGARTEQARMWGTYLVGVAQSRLGRHDEAGRYFLAARALRSTGRGGQHIRAIIERAAAAACLAAGDYERAYEQARMIEQRVVLIGTREHFLSSGERSETTHLLEIESGILSGAEVDLSLSKTLSYAYKELIEALAGLLEEGISERSLGLIERGLSSEDRPSALIASYLGLWRGLQQRFGEFGGTKFNAVGARVEQMTRALESHGFCVGRVKRYEQIAWRLVAKYGEQDARALAGVEETESPEPGTDEESVRRRSLIVSARSLRTVDQEPREGLSATTRGQDRNQDKEEGAVQGEETSSGVVACGWGEPEAEINIQSAQSPRGLGYLLGEAKTDSSLLQGDLQPPSSRQREAGEADSSLLHDRARQDDGAHIQNSPGANRTDKSVGGSPVSIETETVEVQGSDVGTAEWKGEETKARASAVVAEETQPRSDWEWEINRWGWHAMTTVIGHEGASGRMEVWLESEVGDQLLGWVEYAQGGYWEAHSRVAQLLSNEMYVGSGAKKEASAQPALISAEAKEENWDVGVEALWDLYVTCNGIYQRWTLGIETGITESVTNTAQPKLRGRFFRKGLFDLSPTGGLNGVRVTGYDFELARLYDEVFAGVKTPAAALAELRGQLISETEGISGSREDVADELDWEAFERAFSPRVEQGGESATQSAGESVEEGGQPAGAGRVGGASWGTGLDSAKGAVESEQSPAGRATTGAQTSDERASQQRQASAPLAAQDPEKSSGVVVGGRTEASIDLGVLTAGSIGEIFALLSERYCYRLQVWVRTGAGYALLYKFGDGLIETAVGDEISATALREQLRVLSGLSEKGIGYEIGIGYAIVFEVRDGQRREYVQLIFRAWEWGFSSRAAAEEFDFSATEGFVYGDPTTERLLWRVRRLAEHDGLEGRPLAHVLLVGERGVGKEHIAKLIHAWSGRHEFPYVVCNGAVLGLNATLATAELFGAEPGAYTDAPRSGRRGFVEQAGMGTLFIDEVNELTPEVAGLLKRVVQEGDYARLGSTKRERARCRFVLATNRPERLPEDVRDRFYTLEIPPLRARPGDVGPLAQHFASRYGCVVDAKLIDYLRQQPWAGNIRQLERTIYELAMFSPGRSAGEQPYTLSLRDLKATLGHFAETKEARVTEPSAGLEEAAWMGDMPGTLPPPQATQGVALEGLLQRGPQTLDEARALLDHAGGNISEGTERFKRAMVEAALMLENGNQTRAARRLGITRQGLRNLLKSFAGTAESKEQE